MIKNVLSAVIDRRYRAVSENRIFGIGTWILEFTFAPMAPGPPFHPYGLAHLVVVFLTIALPFALAAIVRSKRVEKAVVALLSLLLVANYVAYLVFVRQFASATWGQVLPFQLCDWAMIVVIVALWTHRRGWFEVAYFWGLGGTVQAILTPNLLYGFPDCRFFSFFISHCGIIVGIGFLMLRYHLRPHAWSIVRVFLWTELYFVITLSVDSLTQTNYGFLLHKPEASTLLNILSDNRPLYLFQMHLLALAFFVALYLPFAAYDLMTARRSEVA